MTSGTYFEFLNLSSAIQDQLEQSKSMSDNSSEESSEAKYFNLETDDLNEKICESPERTDMDADTKKTCSSVLTSNQKADSDAPVSQNPVIEQGSSSNSIRSTQINRKFRKNRHNQILMQYVARLEI